MKIAIVILNWNGSNETLSCIYKIRQWSRVLPTIFVVDNNSSDTEKQKLRNVEKDFHLIENDENEGFSEGCNVGIRIALKYDIEAILLLNNDAVIEEEDVLLLIRNMMGNTDIGAIGPLIYDARTNRLINAGGKEIAWHYYTQMKQVKNTLGFYDVDYVSGTALLVRVEVFKKVGLLDERYFFSGEIADFCKRVKKYKRKNGRRYRIVIEPNAKATHDIHDPSKDREKLYTYYSIRNRYLYVRKFYKFFSPALYFFWLYHHLKHALSSFKQNRRDVAAFILKGIFHGLIGKTDRLTK